MNTPDDTRREWYICYIYSKGGRYYESIPRTKEDAIAQSESYDLLCGHPVKHEVVHKSQLPAGVLL